MKNFIDIAWILGVFLLMSFPLWFCGVVFVFPLWISAQIAFYFAPGNNLFFILVHWLVSWVCYPPFAIMTGWFLGSATRPLPSFEGMKSYFELQDTNLWLYPEIIDTRINTRINTRIK